MRQCGLRGAMRGKAVRTKIGDKMAACPLDRVNRQFQAQWPNQLWRFTRKPATSGHGHQSAALHLL
ncbi:hypothetical protein CS8_050990 [Cupriavidus sp. 8B]